MKKISQFLIIFTIFIINISCFEKKQLNYVQFSGKTMGTTYQVKVQINNILLDELKQKIKNLLIKINKQMSTYIKNSEISQFNRFKKLNWFKVSKDLAIVIKESLRISKLSNGNFDITVGPLVNLWGFGYTGRHEKIPSNKKINNILNEIGYDKIFVKKNLKAIKKTNPNIICDLSAIAKGYGVDKIALYLEALKIKNYLVEIGGEIKVKGKNSKNNLWSIGIERPYEKDIQKIVNLKGFSMATSGDYRNFFKKNNKKYSHTINPKTGKPITHNIVSVSVIHQSCMTADALATAINVSGIKKGINLAKKHDLAVFIIYKKDKKLFEIMSEQFKNFLKNK